MLGQQDLPSALAKSNSAGPTTNVLQHFFFLIHFNELGVIVLFNFAYVQGYLSLGMYNNISSAVEFQRWWVLKSNIFCQESRKKFLKIPTGNVSSSKIGHNFRK